jgi:hypothetical protein
MGAEQIGDRLSHAQDGSGGVQARRWDRSSSVS